MQEHQPRVQEQPLTQRLLAATNVYLDDPPAAPGDGGLHEAGVLLDLLITQVRETGSAPGAWLTWTAVTGTFPTSDEVRETLRQFELLPSADAAIWLLRHGLVSSRNSESFDLEMDILVNAVVPSVDYCARVDHHTGIQRVTRETLPRWQRDHEIHPVAWTDVGSIMRDLDPLEADRVLRWNDQLHVGRVTPRGFVHRLVVPWQSNVVLIEVPLPQMTAALRGLAEHSGNTVTAVGYDAIPVVSADLRPYSEPDNYVQYLSVIKHAKRVSGISVSAAQEFRGFAETLPSQGLPGPDVTEAFLPGEAPHAEPRSGHLFRQRPVVISVGSQEEHKNHLGLLYASEVLWREGLDFELQLIGRPGWNAARLETRARSLARRGRHITFRRGISDSELWESYRRARFTVLASFHEGYGLPVAESLACSTPAITTNYGSTREIAEAGGCILVDPRDDDSLVTAMRSLLTDDALLARLEEEARNRPVRLWDNYAQELWEQLVEPEAGR